MDEQLADFADNGNAPFPAREGFSTTTDLAAAKRTPIPDLSWAADRRGALTTLSGASDNCRSPAEIPSSLISLSVFIGCH